MSFDFSYVYEKGYSILFITSANALFMQPFTMNYFSYILFDGFLVLVDFIVELNKKKFKKDY
jgi:hypothetical protein